MNYGAPTHKAYLCAPTQTNLELWRLKPYEHNNLCMKFNNKKMSTLNILFSGPILQHFVAFHKGPLSELSLFICTLKESKRGSKMLVYTSLNARRVFCLPRRAQGG